MRVTDTHLTSHSYVNLHKSKLTKKEELLFWQLWPISKVHRFVIFKASLWSSLSIFLYLLHWEREHDFCSFSFFNLLHHWWFMWMSIQDLLLVNNRSLLILTPCVFSSLNYAMVWRRMLLSQVRGPTHYSNCLLLGQLGFRKRWSLILPVRLMIVSRSKQWYPYLSLACPPFYCHWVQPGQVTHPVCY